MRRLKRQQPIDPHSGPTISYIPGSAVAKLQQPSVIISIAGSHDSRPAIDEKHTVHEINFDIGSWAEEAGKTLQVEQIEALIAFCDEHGKDKDIIVHCTAGECRSYTIATLLSIHLESPHRLTRHEFAATSNYMDHRTEKAFHRYMWAKEDKE